MTSVTNIDFQFRLCAFGHKRISATTGHFRFDVIRVYAFFHGSNLRSQLMLQKIIYLIRVGFKIPSPAWSLATRAQLRPHFLQESLILAGIGTKTRGHFVLKQRAGSVAQRNFRNFSSLVHVFDFALPEGAGMAQPINTST